MEIVTGSTGVAHVTPIDDAVRNSNLGYYRERVVFDTLRAFEARAITANEVRVYSGYGMNQGRLFKIDQSDFDSVTIENGTQGLKRADLIVARYTMNSQTGFENISLVVIKGQSGQAYVDPSYVTGNINEGDSQDDFPLYRVKINGVVIDGDPEPLFEALPDGGRFGFIEEKINNHIANEENPHIITWTIAQTLANINVSETLAVQFGKIAKAISDLISHINNTQNPHNVSGSQLSGVVPISKGGTGATTALQALANLGVPADVADSMPKATYDPDGDGVIAIAQGGTGKTSWTQGKVLVGNGTGIPTERAIDSTSGGTTNSNALITSGAVKSKISEMQATFQNGVDTIYNAIVRNGVTPSSSTPNACATGIDNVYQKGKTDAEAVTWTEMLNPTFVGKNSGTVSTKIENYLELRVSLANVVNFKITGMSNISIENSGYPEVDITYYNGSTEIGTVAIYELNKNFTPPNNATEMKLQAWSNVSQVGIGGQVTSSYVMMLTKRAKKLR